MGEVGPGPDGGLQRRQRQDRCRPGRSEFRKGGQNSAEQPAKRGQRGKASTSALNALQSTVSSQNSALTLRNCRFVTGSYTGTGKYGPSNANSLTFPQKPAFVCVVSDINGMVLDITVLGFGALEDVQLRNLLLSMILSAIWTQRTTARSMTPPIILLLDEAQTLPWGNGSIMKRTLCEGRKYGFLHMGTDALRASMEQNRCPFGFSWKLGDRNGYKIPTIAFVAWLTKGTYAPAA